MWTSVVELTIIARSKWRALPVPMALWIFHFIQSTHIPVKNSISLNWFNPIFCTFLCIRSHCACDDEFFSCLKALPTPVSRMIGNLYFNVIQMPCVDELQSASSDGPAKSKLEILQPELCTARVSNGECTGPSIRRPFQPRPYKFVNINRVFWTELEHIEIKKMLLKCYPPKNDKKFLAYTSPSIYERIFPPLIVAFGYFDKTIWYC